MVRGAVKRVDPWKRMRRSYKKYKTNAIPLYPPVWDSTVFYFNYQVTVNYPANAGVGWWFPAGQFLTSQNFINVGSFFNFYRVEKVTITLCLAEVADAALVTMATFHDEHGFGQARPDSNTIRQSPDVQTFSNYSMPKKVWKFDPNYQNDSDFIPIPAAIGVADSTQGGVAVYMTTTTVGSTLQAFTALGKYKVRVRGRGCINI